MQHTSWAQKIYSDRSTRLIGLSQDTYMQKVLNRFSKQNSKKGFLSMSHGISLSETQGLLTPDERERMSGRPYASAIGFIICATLCTCPDVSYALRVTSRYQVDPSESHWTGVRDVLK